MSQMMMVDQLLPFGARGSDTTEQTVFEQLAGRKPDSPRRPNAPVGGTVFAQPSVRAGATGGAGRTLPDSRLTNWFALPLACLALMAVDLLCEWVITTVSPLGVAGALFPPLLLFLGVAGAGAHDHRAAPERFCAAATGPLMSAAPPARARPARMSSISRRWGFIRAICCRAYLRQTLMVAAALMTIALTIDLWPQIPLLTGNSAPGTVWTVDAPGRFAHSGSAAALYSVRDLSGRGVERERLHRIA